MEKEEWAKPELVVLVKGQPEENVLTQCKAVNGPASNTEIAATGQNCKVREGPSQCGACQACGGGTS